MTKLPSSDKIIKLLSLHGFSFKSSKGSHQKYTNGQRIVIIPAPRKEVPVGTLKSISRQSGIDFREFLSL